MTYNKSEVLMLGHAAEVIQGRAKPIGCVDAIFPGGRRVWDPPNPAVDLDE